jgi:hypothetical protein
MQVARIDGGNRQPDAFGELGCIRQLGQLANRIRNSSPPQRAQTSYSRMLSRMQLAPASTRIADGMAGAVVDFLEEIDVQQGNRKGFAGAFDWAIA